MENNNGTAIATARSAYEGKVGIEAVLRSGGKNPQLKSVVHEVLYRDSVTLSPENLLSGTKGILSKSATAVRDDVLTMNAGSVVGRAQLKDTVAGISKTVKRFRRQVRGDEPDGHQEDSGRLQPGRAAAGGERRAGNPARTRRASRRRLSAGR